MAQDLIKYKKRLDEVLPSGKAQESLRSQLILGDKLCCWFCSLPKDMDQYTGDSIVCNHCLPDLVRKIEATKLAVSGRGFSVQMEKLRQSSEPEFINEVDKMFAAMQGKDMSLGEETVNMYSTLTGKDLPEDEKKHFIADNKTAARLINLMWDAAHKRDASLSSSNPFEGISEKDLLGTALQSVIDSMLTDEEFAMSVVSTMYDRYPGFLDLVRQCDVLEEVQ